MEGVDEAMTTTVFGIGCIYFGYEQHSEKVHLDHGAYIKDLQSRLGGLENITNIAFIEGTLPPYGGAITIEDDDKNVVIPIIHDGTRFSFDIYIPFRVQKTFDVLCDVEMIHVDFIYGYDVPLMFVSYSWPLEEGDAQPSSAVVVVRKYLEGKLSTEDFRCGCIGPSPFHANFSVIEHNIEEHAYIKDVSATKSGYGLIELNSSVGMPLLEAVSRSELDSMLSQFYALSETRSRLIGQHGTIAEQSRELLRLSEEVGWRSPFKRWSMNASAIDSLKKAMFYETLTRIELSDRIAEGERAGYIGAESPLNDSFLEYRTMAAENRWSEFSGLADFFEGRRQKLIENLITISVGLIGGIVGAVIGSLATYALSKEPSASIPNKSTKPEAVIRAPENKSPKGMDQSKTKVLN